MIMMPRLTGAHSVTLPVPSGCNTFPSQLDLSCNQGCSVHVMMFPHVDILICHWLDFSWYCHIFLLSLKNIEHLNI